MSNGQKTQLDRIEERLERIEKKSSKRFIASTSWPLFAAAIAAWGWALRADPINMAYYGAGWFCYLVGFLIFLYALLKK